MDWFCHYQRLPLWRQSSRIVSFPGQRRLWVALWEADALETELAKQERTDAAAFCSFSVVQKTNSNSKWKPHYWLTRPQPHSSCSVAQLCLTLWDPMDRPQHARPPCPSPSPEVCPSSCPLHWWCHPAISSSDALFSFCPQSFLATGLFSSESAVHIRWPKYWSFSFSISPSNEYSGLISLKIDWFDLLAVQETLGSLLQHHCSKASILQCTAFFTVQFSQLYMITVKTIALTIQIQKNIYFCFIDYAKAFDL